MNIVARSYAKANGLKRYFTGKPCHKGHVAERITLTGHCLVCAAERQKIKRENDPEKWKAIDVKSKSNMSPERKAIVKAQSSARYKAWAKSNAEHLKSYGAEYMAANKTKIAERDKAYRDSNKEIIRAKDKAWKKNNHAKVVANAKNYKMKKTFAMPKWADAKAIADIYEQALKLTRSTGIVYHVDHIVPLRGKNVSGLHVENNLRVITAAENMAKGNKYE